MVRALRQTRAGKTLDKAPTRYGDASAMARALFAQTGGEIRLALPLGLGKPVTLVNALTQAALADPSLKLSIFTALTLQRPDPGSDIEKRFLGPAMDRLFGTYPALHYGDMIKAGTLPKNITVSEFFFQAGAWLGNDHAQRHYISANYTHALDVLIAQKPNVLSQLLPQQGDRFSLSCNTDISADLFALRRAGKMDFIAVAERNDALPFMPGPAEIAPAEFAMLLEPAQQLDLFSVPRRPVSDAQYAIALHVSRLIVDGGTLQIGIGAIGDAVAQALLLRDRGALGAIWEDAPFPLRGDGTDAFDTGLYAVTEMLVGGLLALFEAGILRREVSGAVIHAGFFVDARDLYERLIAISDSRFQGGLVKAAQKAGKLAVDCSVHPDHRNNLPARLRHWLAPHRSTVLPEFPLGTDFDIVEQKLLPALSILSTAASSKRRLAGLIWAALTAPAHPQEEACMSRMGFSGVPIWNEPLQVRALRGALRIQHRSV